MNLVSLILLFFVIFDFGQIVVTVDPYKVLKISFQADQIQIKKAYSKLLKKYKKNQHQLQLLREAYQQIITVRNLEQSKLLKQRKRNINKKIKQKSLNSNNEKKFPDLFGDQPQHILNYDVFQFENKKKIRQNNLQIAKFIILVLNFLFKIAVLYLIYYCWVKGRILNTQKNGNKFKKNDIRNQQERIYQNNRQFQQIYRQRYNNRL